MTPGAVARCNALMEDITDFQVEKVAGDAYKLSDLSRVAGGYMI